MRYIHYTYDAAGIKLRKEADGLTTDYIGGMVYENNILKYILTDYGKIIPSGSSYIREYNITDHLGNVRVTFNESGEIMQEESYYPFGMTMNGLNYMTTNKSYVENKYLYNGKELQEDFDLDWYDYGARMYDAQLGRWHVPDPMSESRIWLSPYQYAQNNPIKFIDPNGMLDSLYINGENPIAAFQELQKSTTMLLSRDNTTGKIEAKGDVNTESDARLLDVINSSSIDVNVETRKGVYTSEGYPFIGGAFMGNTVTKTDDGNTVVANQVINPEILSKMSRINNAPGQDVLHEITEAFEGAKISQVSGISSPLAGKGSVYNIAHNRAIPQSGFIFEHPNYKLNEVKFSTSFCPPNPYILNFKGTPFLTVK